MYTVGVLFLSVIALPACPALPTTGTISAMSASAAKFYERTSDCVSEACYVDYECSGNTTTSVWPTGYPLMTCEGTGSVHNSLNSSQFFYNWFVLDNSLRVGDGIPARSQELYLEFAVSEFLIPNTTFADPVGTVEIDVLNATLIPPFSPQLEGDLVYHFTDYQPYNGHSPHLCQKCGARCLPQVFSVTVNVTATGTYRANLTEHWRTGQIPSLTFIRIKDHNVCLNWTCQYPCVSQCFSPYCKQRPAMRLSVQEQAPRFVWNATHCTSDCPTSTCSAIQEPYYTPTQCCPVCRNKQAAEVCRYLHDNSSCAFPNGLRGACTYTEKEGRMCRPYTECAKKQPGDTCDSGRGLCVELVNDQGLQCASPPPGVYYIQTANSGLRVFADGSMYVAFLNSSSTPPTKYNLFNLTIDPSGKYKLTTQVDQYYGKTVSGPICIPGYKNMTANSGIWAVSSESYCGDMPGSQQWEVVFTENSIGAPRGENIWLNRNFTIEAEYAWYQHDNVVPHRWHSTMITTQYCKGASASSGVCRPQYIDQAWYFDILLDQPPSAPTADSLFQLKMPN